ncbi:MAG: hypothetical protein ACO2O6_09760 [Candidatus Hydrothermia bacterium]
MDCEDGKSIFVHYMAIEIKKQKGVISYPFQIK